VTYRAELSDRVLGQLRGLPAKAFDALIETMSAVVEYPDDPMRTFPTNDPYVLRAEFGLCRLGHIRAQCRAADGHTDRRDLDRMTCLAAVDSSQRGRE